MNEQCHFNIEDVMVKTFSVKIIKSKIREYEYNTIN